MMIRMAIKFFAAAGFFLISFSLQAQLKGAVSLFPAGDFVLSSSAITGSAQLMEDGSYKATNISISVDTLKTGMDLRDKHMKEKYLDFKKYPNIILTEAIGKGGKGTGILKVKDQTQKVSGTYSISGARLTAKFPVKVSGFGINDVNYMGVGVEDEIIIEISVPVTKTTAPVIKPEVKTELNPKKPAQPQMTKPSTQPKKPK